MRKKQERKMSYCNFIRCFFLLLSFYFSDNCLDITFIKYITQHRIFPCDKIHQSQLDTRFGKRKKCPSKFIEYSRKKREIMHSIHIKSNLMSSHLYPEAQNCFSPNYFNNHLCGTTGMNECFFIL